MHKPEDISFEMIKLAGGDRLLRLTYPPLGLALEKKIDPAKPVAAQKARLMEAFEAALSKAEVAA